MGTRARTQFEENKKDINNLLLFHSEKGGKGPGRREKRLEVLHKSSIVLTTAIWEAFCEDLAEEAIGHIVKHTDDASKLSKDIRKRVAKEVKDDPNDLAVWSLAGNGWKKHLRDRFDSMREERNRKLNTPKSGPIDELFEKSLGLPGLSSSWYWPGMTAQRARKKLDRFVSLRGEIAHRGAASETCKKGQVEAYLNHVSRIVEKSDECVAEFVRATSGKTIRHRVSLGPFVKAPKA